MSASHYDVHALGPFLDLLVKLTVLEMDDGRPLDDVMFDCLVRTRQLVGHDVFETLSLEEILALSRRAMDDG